MLIDLHCHTAERSRCSSVGVERLLELARRRGLGGVCLTEHDVAWPEEELEELAVRSSLAVVGGVEWTLPEGHVLSFGVRTAGPFRATEELFAAAESEGGLLYLAHPARDGLLRVTADTVRWFSSVEAANGSDGRLQNLAAAGLAKGFRLPGIGGSDAHSEAEVAVAATRLSREVSSTAELVEALRSGEYEAVVLE